MALENVRAEIRALLEPSDLIAWRAQMASRQAFLGYIRDPEFRAAVDDDPEVFHELLLEAEERGWIHYSRLAAGMGLGDASNSSRWFKTKTSGARKSPDQFRRRFALLALARIVERDTDRLNEGMPPIGGLSVREYPHLEFEVPRDAA